MKTNKLLKLTKQYFDEGYFDSRVRSLLNQSEFKDDEIDYLWEYIFKIQKKVLKTQGDSMNMSTLKAQISRLIGVDLSSNYTNTVNKSDLYKIYMYITSLPEEYLKDRLNG